MTYKIATNRIGTKTVLRIYANTNVSVNALSIGSTEIVGAATLTCIYCTGDGAQSVVYSRGNTSVSNNNIARFWPQDNGFIDFAGNGTQPDADLKTANIIFTVPTANVQIVAEFHKVSSANTDY